MQTLSYQELGNALKAARLEKRLTQKNLAERLGITTRHLISIEKGERAPSCDLLFRIVRELDISADTIFYPDTPAGRTALARLKALLRRCDEKEVDVIIAAIKTLLETKRQGGESDVTLNST